MDVLYGALLNMWHIHTPELRTGVTKRPSSLGSLNLPGDFYAPPLSSPIRASHHRVLNPHRQAPSFQVISAGGSQGYDPGFPLRRHVVMMQLGSDP